VENTLDEERRLFYVAITRAMLTLRLSYCRSRKKYGAPSQCHPSPFLQELPAECVEDAAERSKKPVAAASGGNMFSMMREAAQ
jgi:superfamily I DNA/RNA helicase